MDEENDLRPETEERIISSSGRAVSSNDVRMSSGSISTGNLTGRAESNNDDAVRDEAAPINRHNITIHSLDFGYNVKIGCQNFAVESVERLIKNLEAYLKEPQETERKWMRERKLL